MPKKEKPREARKQGEETEMIELLDDDKLPPAEAAERDADESFKDHKDAIIEAFRSYCN